MKFKLFRIVKWLPFILLGLYPLIWFIGKGNVLINGLDTNFPIDPVVWFTRRFYIWNEILNGGLHFSSSVAGLFFHFLQVLPYLLGASLQTVEIFNIIFWSLAIVLSSYLFSKVFITKRILLQLLFVVLYSCNIYLFNTWENIKVANLSLMVGLPLLLTLIHQRVQKRWSTPRTLLFATLTGIVSAGTGINPAYFLSLVSGAALYVLLLLIIKSDRLNTLKASAITIIPFVLVNSFWIFPLIDFLFITNTVQGLEGIGFTNWVASLSENTSLLNVIRLQGAWDWYIRNDFGVPLYIPYASRYFYSTPFIIFSFVTPLLALCSFVFRKTKHIKSMFFCSILAVLGIFLGAGTHEPTGIIFTFLLKNLPFFSFFRSPWYIFTPFTIIGISGLAVIFFDELYEKFSEARIYNKFRGVHGLTLVVGVLITGQLLYSYPQITGKIFRPGRDDSFYQYFPQYVFDTQDYLKTSNYNRIVTYPDDQLESFKWGYKGTESILSLFSDKEVIAPSFNYPNQNLAALIQKFYSHLKRGEFNSAFSMVHAFGADSMFVKNDTITLSPNISDDITEFTSERKTIGPWDFMRIDKQYVSQKFSIPEHIYALDISPNKLAEVMRFISPNSLIVERRDSQLKNIPEATSQFGSINQARATSSSTNGSVTYTYKTSQDNKYWLYFSNFNLPIKDINVTVDGTIVSSSLLKSENNALKIGPFDNQLTDHTITLNVPKPHAEILINSEGTNIIGTPTIESIYTIPVPNFNPFKKYKISFQHIYEYGEAPEFQLVQSGPASPYQVKPVTLIKSQDWLEDEFVFEPVELSSKLEIIIKQPKQDKSVSKASIRNLSVTELYENDLYVVEEAAALYDVKPQITFKKLSPVKYEVVVENAQKGYFISMKDGYHRGWNISSKDYMGGKQVHMTGNGFSNLWYIPVGGEKQTISVTFFGQTLYMVGCIVSILVLLSTSLFYLYATKKRS